VRNAVENPILNSPFREPERHYDFSGPEPRVVPGRRPAGYHGVARTDQVQGALAANPFIPLDRVNEIRARVNAWRERGWPGVTPVTRDLLEHWSREDRRPLFFAQREAAETIIWLTEGAAADRQGVDVPEDAPNDPESEKKGYAALRRYCTKMATGSGKTTVMAMVAAWSILNKLANRQDARFSDAVLVVCPNLTVKERLQVLKPQLAGNYYERFDLVPAGYRALLARGRLDVTNWHEFNPKDDARSRGIVQRGRESDGAFARRALDRDLGKAANLLVLNDEAHHAYRPARAKDDDQLALPMSAEERDDAKQFAEEATVWVGGLDRIHATRGIRLVVDLSATPFYLKGTGYPEGQPLPWIVSDFGLVDAIESGITKVPRIPVMDNSGRPDPQYFRLWQAIMDKLPESERQTARRGAKPEGVWRNAHGALVTLAAKWKATFERFRESRYPVPPVLIVVAANTALAKLVADSLRTGGVVAELAGDATFEINTRVLAEAEAEEGGTKEDAAQRLRITTATVGKAEWPDGRPPDGFEDLAAPPGRDIRCVVSVGMLTEGWDAQNVTQIFGVRAFTTQLLCEQVVGRALRRMSYEVGPDGLLEPEYADIFGVPFEVIPVQGVRVGAAPPLPPPSTLVQALPSRKDREIEFPRVEGFVMDVRQRIRCNLDAVPTVRVEPQIETTEVVTRSQMGLGSRRPGLGTTLGEPEVLTRDEFHREHRLQRTAFEIARDVTEALAGARVAGAQQFAPRKPQEGARLLFPQVLRFAQEFLERRLDLAPGAVREEAALEVYRQPIVSRLLAAIEPDTDAGETAILPRIERHRPVGRTSEVMFRSTKPTKETMKSHVSHVVLDSPTWEGTVAYHLEMSPRVQAWVRNERLDFEILYEWDGRTHKYLPDFLARIETAAGYVMLVLEVKGYEREQDRAKYQGAEKWVRAVNAHGGFGRWAFMVCKEPNALRDMLDKFAARAA
jgi:type III restriction enzyme